MIKFGSVCSGIEAACVAWEPLGWRAAWLSEIEAFPSAVLAYHWPGVPNLGDMTSVEFMLQIGLEAPDVLVGGTPCQSFSVAGMRGGLEDDRGQLSLEYIRILNEIDRQRQSTGRPLSVCIWENVPGVLSSKDNAFGCFLAALAGEDEELQPAGKRWSNAGCVFGPQRTVAWRVLDAQYFGLAQRRRRVFVVASARDGFDPTAVLFEFDGVRRDSAPSRETGQSLAADVTQCLKASGSGTARVGDTRGQDNVVATHPSEIGNTLTARMHKGVNSTLDEGQSLVYPIHDKTTRHAGQTGKGSGNGLGVGQDGDPCPTLTTGDKHAVYAFQPRIARNGRGDMGELVHALSAEAGTTGKGDASPCVAVHGNQDPIVSDNRAHALGRNQGQEDAVYASAAVRRLTPTECERLQGFPDGHTLIPYRNKTADQCPDGPRYKALGNSMAVPVMRWLGERIDAQIRGDYDQVQR